MTQFANTLAYVPTPEFWALMTLVAGGFIKFLYQVHKDRVAAKRVDDIHKQAISDREQTRLDLAAVAALTVDQLAVLEGRIMSVDENGKTRLKVMLNSNATTRAFTKKAIDTANNTNDKIALLGQSIVEGNKTPTVDV